MQAVRAGWRVCSFVQAGVWAGPPAAGGSAAPPPRQKCLRSRGYLVLFLVAPRRFLALQHAHAFTTSAITPAKVLPWWAEAREERHEVLGPSPDPSSSPSIYPP